MKRKAILSLLLLATLSISLFVVNTSVEAQYEDVQEHCTNPTESRTIIASPSGDDNDLSFDKEEIEVPKDTCVEIKLINNAPTMEHDFVIDFTAGSDGIKFVDIHLLNSTAGPYNNGTDTFNIKTPDADISFEFYCSIDGHHEAGMEGTLIVGSGASGNTDEGSLSITNFVITSLTFLVISFIARNKTRGKLQ